MKSKPPTTKAHLQLSNNFGGRVLVTLFPSKSAKQFTVSDARARIEFKKFVDTFQQSISGIFGIYAGYKTSTGLMENLGVGLTDVMIRQEAAQGFFFNAVKPHCTVVGFDHVGMNMKIRVVVPTWLIELVNNSGTNESSSIPR